MTDEERQAIAGKLRQRAALWQTAYDYGACPEPYSAGLMRILRDEVTDAIGIDRLSPPDRILERLAELADRPECENLSMKPADELLCSVCGEHVDIARMGDCEDYHARFCPTCGDRVRNGHH